MAYERRFLAIFSEVFQSDNSSEVAGGWLHFIDNHQIATLPRHRKADISQFDTIETASSPPSKRLELVTGIGSLPLTQPEQFAGMA
jgi:hypothetical protein